MKFINSFKKAKTSVKITAIASLVICFSIPLVFLAFPHFLKNRQLFNIIYVNNNGQQRVVSIYSETGNSDDGSYLSGYWLKLHDPEKNKPVHQLFIKYRGDDIPQFPYVYSFTNEIWLVENPGTVSTEKSFLKVIKIVDDKLTLLPTDFLQGWKIQNVYNNQITVSNSYNELGCLDVSTKNITSTPCVIENNDTTKTLSTMFFWVRNTSTSTRCKLYYYRSTEKYPEADVFSGVPPADGTIPGWHLPDAVNMGYGKLDEDVVQAYKIKFKPYEYVGVINDSKLYNSPSILHQNDSICTFISSEDDGKTNTIYQFSSKNKLIWKTTCPKLKNTTSQYNMKVQYTTKETIVIDPVSCVFCIDNTTGNIRWQCPK